MTTSGSLTRLACLWAEQELCGPRPKRIDPFEWACQEQNLDSFLLYVRLKQLPRVPSFCEAVIQQRRAIEDEAEAAKKSQNLADRLAIELPGKGEIPGKPHDGQHREADPSQPRMRAEAPEQDDLTRLANLWSQQELCGRRPAKVDPFVWACHEPNIDSFMLFVRLKQLPKVPTFREAVVQQRQAMDEEAVAAKSQRGLADRLTIQPPAASKAVSYSMFDDAEGMTGSLSQTIGGNRTWSPPCRLVTWLMRR